MTNHRGNFCLTFDNNEKVDCTVYFTASLYETALSKLKRIALSELEQRQANGLSIDNCEDIIDFEHHSNITIANEKSYHLEETEYKRIWKSDLEIPY